MYGIINTLDISMRGADIFITVYEHSEVYSEEGGELHRCYFQICVIQTLDFLLFLTLPHFLLLFFPPPLPLPSHFSFT